MVVFLYSRTKSERCNFDRRWRSRAGSFIGFFVVVVYVELSPDAAMSIEYGLIYYLLIFRFVVAHLSGPSEENRYVPEDCDRYLSSHRSSVTAQLKS